MMGAEDLVRVAKENRMASIKRSLEVMPNRSGTYYLRRRRKLSEELAALQLELLHYELFNQCETVR